MGLLLEGQAISVRAARCMQQKLAQGNRSNIVRDIDNPWIFSYMGWNPAYATLNGAQVLRMRHVNC